MEKFLNHKTTFIDVGANIGYFSIFAEKIYNSKVIAIEPSFKRDFTIQENMELNNCKNIVTHTCACGSEEKLPF